MRAKILKSISIVLISALFCQVPLGSFATLDKVKLMKLDPLPSKRAEKMIEDERTTKLWGAFLLTAAGAAIIGANTDLSTSAGASESYQQNHRDWHRTNQLLGGTYVVIGLAQLFIPSSFERDLKIAEQLQLPAEEKEEIIYYKMKTKAEEMKAERQLAGITGMILGAGFAVASGNFEVEANKSTTLSAALVLAAMGAAFYFIPCEIENQVHEMDKGLGISFSF